MVQPEFMASVEKIRALAWHRLPANASLEQLLQLAMNYMIEKEDPLKRSERRAQRKVHAVKPSARVRHIAAAARDDVFARDHGRCTFVGPDGRRCSATTGLQIDHVTPVSLGGKGDPDNLRLLCAAHNRFEAERMGLGRPVETTSMKKQRDRKESHFG
jgi:5-methylcytosine-specific restriction endonuclease McrA